MHTQRNNPITRGAFTLVEMAASLAISSILLVGMGSAVLITTHAIPTQNPTQGVLGAGNALARIADELRYADIVLHAAPTDVTFMVADRNGDKVPERIRYSWTGVKGDPLVRELNLGAPSVIVDDVHAFSFSFDLEGRSEVVAGTTTLVTSDEHVLAANDDTVGATPLTLQSQLANGQHIVPNLPADTRHWLISSVEIYAHQVTGADGRTTSIELWSANDDTTPNERIETQIIAHADMSPVDDWISVSFVDAIELRPKEGYCIVLDPPADPAAVVNTQDGGAEVAGFAFLSHDGTSWQSTPTRSLLYRVRGKYTRAIVDDAHVVTREYARTAGLSIQTGVDRSGGLETAVRLVNAPEILGALWEADFSDDPATLDIDGDGLADWTSIAGELSAGIWHAGDNALRTRPDHNLDALTTVEFTGRDTTIDGKSAKVHISADRTGSVAAEIDAILKLRNNGQHVVIKTTDASYNKTLLVDKIFAAGAFLDVRLIIDPDADVVNVRVEGEDLGTYPYERVSTSYHPGIKLRAAGGNTGPEFDSVRVRVGGFGTSTADGSNTPPVAAASISDTMIEAGDAINFDGTGSTDPDGDPITYYWDFGDGDIVGDASGTHTYETVGIYPVTLTVFDGRGGTDTDTAFVNVSQPAKSVTASSDSLSGWYGGSKNGYTQWW